MAKGRPGKKKNNYNSIGFRDAAIRRINATPGDVEIYNPRTGRSRLVYAPKNSPEEKQLFKKRVNPMDKR